MYPSGPWVGHWDQDGMGRQSMHDLVLEFDAHRISGQGRDCVGEFTLRGEIAPDATVSLIKQYVGRHAVVYSGQHDGEGMIFGVWVLHGDDGKFAMRPAGGFLTSDIPITETKF